MNPEAPACERWRRLAFALAVLAAATPLAACGGKSEATASQTAAKVNKEEITVHQINHVLERQRGLRPDATGKIEKQLLERLIDQELAVQKAIELKLDRDPRVVQQLEAMKREIIARAYAERVGEGVSQPTPEEVQKYYEDNPALFKERRLYQVQEIAIEATPEQLPALREKLKSAKSISEFVESLKASDFRFTGSQATRAAEQLPLASLTALSKMRDGQSMFNPAPNGAQVVVLSGSRNQPVSLETARPAIEKFLLNERKRELVNKQVKSLRQAANIRYVGKFAGGAGPSHSSEGPASAAASEEGGAMSEGDIRKGMGLQK